MGRHPNDVRFLDESTSKRCRVSRHYFFEAQFEQVVRVPKLIQGWIGIWRLKGGGSYWVIHWVLHAFLGTADEFLSAALCWSHVVIHDRDLYKLWRNYQFESAWANAHRWDIIHLQVSWMRTKVCGMQQFAVPCTYAHREATSFSVAETTYLQLSRMRAKIFPEEQLEKA